MIEWITNHWPILSAMIGGPVILVCGWIGAHHGKIQTGFRWIRKQCHLSAENTNLTAQLAAAEDGMIAAKASATKLKSERDILAKRLEPALQPPEIEIIRFLAKRGTSVECCQLRKNFGIERTRFDYHMDRLTGTFFYIRCRSFADTRPEVYELTEPGKAYAVTKNLC